ncbi:hypothetical protein RRG08_040725 [Elysia crispata]|uniref:Uncharacterized protein n=1 Tax=Elysia crispata TaxID=231223 RepID=A0AAE1BFP4_9GAST|nr:hypothetical protein RRG08_040725 [Elysia crispata]
MASQGQKVLQCPMPLFTFTVLETSPYFGGFMSRTRPVSEQCGGRNNKRCNSCPGCSASPAVTKDRSGFPSSLQFVLTRFTCGRRRELDLKLSTSRRILVAASLKTNRNVDLIMQRESG